MWGIFEVFLSTMLVCTVTALAILSSGAWRPGGRLQAGSDGGGLHQVAPRQGGGKAGQTEAGCQERGASPVPQVEHGPAPELAVSRRAHFFSPPRIWSFGTPWRPRCFEVVWVELLSRLTDFLWNPWLLGLFLTTGLVYSAGSGFFQLFEFPVWWRATAGSLFRRPQVQEIIDARAERRAALLHGGSVPGGGEHPLPQSGGPGGGGRPAPSRQPAVLRTGQGGAHP